MRNKSMMIRFIQLLTIIVLYHISGNKTLFLYITTFSLYNVLVSCFSHIKIKDSLKKSNDNYQKYKILKNISICIFIIYLIFIILSIFIGEITNIFLNLQNTFIPYLMMGISIITEPLLKLLLEFLESYNKQKLSNKLLDLYYIIESISLLIISTITLRLFKIPLHISISLMYLSKIISFIVVVFIIYKIFKKINITRQDNKNIKYYQEIKEITTKNLHKSFITLVKNSYYYISIIIMYKILSTRYTYEIKDIEETLTFIYLYGMYCINFIINIISTDQKKDLIITEIINTFDKMLKIAIIISVTSPLICKLIFLSNDFSIYLMMLIFLAIFITMYNITFKYIKNTKIIYISLFMGILSKIILIMPLVNSFYRMGYNLMYGDIISTIISLSISIIINYIYIKLNNLQEKSIEEIFKTLYESILLCIVLVILQFIIPIKAENYIKSMVILLLYITVSIEFIKRKKRG